MPDIVAIIQTGAANPWIYLPAAVLLGALHALEPGHSKSMMAAFIVAVGGTPGQAALLGVSAAIGHTIVVWAIALLGLYLADHLILERAEPWLILVSGLLIIALAIRIFWVLRSLGHDHHDPGHEDHGHDHPHDHVHRHGEGHEHGEHDHGHGDAHAAAHARAVGTRFKHRRVTSLDIAWFGFTGGLLPCPAAIAVLLICLQLKQFTLGVAMVAAFSVGLAATLVAVGVAAVWGARTVANRWSGFERFSRQLPYLSATIVLAIGGLITAQGLARLNAL